MSHPVPQLEFSGVSKSFSRVPVLENVSFKVPAGGAIGLVGENGAGKSTLMNILAGNLPADAGTMRLDGQLFAPRTPLDATARGIAFIHQELNLFGNLSVAENIFLTSAPLRAGLINRAELHRRTAGLLREVGLEIEPGRAVETLSAGERQLVEVAKALSIDARLIIFDEPTTSLTSREAEHLFALITQLRSRGIAIIYISHTLPDVLRLCDEVVVLRDGQVAGSGLTRDFTIPQLVSLMVGRELNQMFPPKSPEPSEQGLLTVTRLSEPGAVKEINFILHAGEVLGIAGLMGAGRSELARILFGLDRHSSGEIRVTEPSDSGSRRPVRNRHPRHSIREGIAFVTENRRSEGLLMEASIAENLTLPSLQSHAGGWTGWLSRDGLREAVSRIREVVRLDSKTSDAQPVRTLSGGNQQKVVIGKWLLRQPRVLILDEPTRGIDVGARYEIYRLIHELAEGGAGILVISSEIEELIGICHRILVMRRGEIVDEMAEAEFNRERILGAALGSKEAGQ